MSSTKTNYRFEKKRTTWGKNNRNLRQKNKQTNKPKNNSKNFAQTKQKYFFKKSRKKNLPEK